MTWRELAEKIQALTPKQQEMLVVIEDDMERDPKYINNCTYVKDLQYKPIPILRF